MLTYEETGCCRDNVRRLFSEGDEVDDDNVDRDRPQSPPVTAAAAAGPTNTARLPQTATSAEASAFAGRFVLPILAAV